MLDEEILDLFFARSEDAIIQLAEKYGKLCRQTSYNILGDNSDAEECVNDSYLGVWNAIPPARPENLLTYLLKIVKNISLNRYHKNHAKKRNSAFDVAVDELAEVLPSGETIESVLEANELTREIEAFLDSLNQENRVVFIRRYWFFDTYEQIAKRIGITEKNVSVRLSRMRIKLREHLTERGIVL